MLRCFFTAIWTTFKKVMVFQNVILPLFRLKVINSTTHLYTLLRPGGTFHMSFFQCIV